mgnify:CR=1 FL=1
MKLEPRIHDSRNGLDYVLTDNYYLPALRLPEDKRPIGRWGRLHNLISWQFDILPTHFHRNLQRQKWVQGKG